MFSVVIPYYKKRQYIERCIESVFSQTYKIYEIIVVDDGSHDDLKDLIERKYKGKVQLIEQVNQGVSAARNKGIQAATHDFVALLDADDCWSPYYLESAANIIAREGNVKIIGSHYSRVKKDVEEERKALVYHQIQNYFEKQICKNTLFTSSSSIILRSFFINNIFNTQLKRGEDLDLWFRVVLSGGKIIYITNTLVYYSDEDAGQATNRIGNLEDSILFNFKDLYAEYISKDERFRKSISKFVYLNLYPYYFSDQNHEAARKILMEIPYHASFMHIIYLIPFQMGKKILNSEQGKLKIRQYLKFAANNFS